QAIEWKLCVGIWIACGAAAGFVATSDKMLSLWQVVALVSLALLVLVIFAILATAIHRANRLDARQSYWWSSAVEDAIGRELPEELSPLDAGPPWLRHHATESAGDHVSTPREGVGWRAAWQ